MPEDLREYIYKICICKYMFIRFFLHYFVPISMRCKDLLKELAVVLSFFVTFRKVVKYTIFLLVILK